MTRCRRRVFAVGGRIAVAIAARMGCTNHARGNDSARPARASMPFDGLVFRRASVPGALAERARALAVFAGRPGRRFCLGLGGSHFPLFESANKSGKAKLKILEN